MNYRKKICLLVFIVILTIVIIFVVNLYPFLAITKRVNTAVLVVEGYLPDTILQQAVSEFNNGKYTTLITIGGELKTPCTHGNCQTMAIHIAKRLNELGIRESSIIAVPNYHENDQYKTYSSFLNLKKWLAQDSVNIKSLNVFSACVHARKSYLLCKKASGRSVKVGIISGKSNQFNSKYWWLSYEGTRIITKNIIGYIYTLYLVVRY